MPFGAKTLSTTLLIVALCSCAPELRKNAPSASGPKRWESFPVDVHVSQEIADTPDLIEGLQAATNFWSQKAERELFRVVGPHAISDATPWEEVPVNLIRFASEWPWNPQEKGRTLVISRGSTISRSVVTFKKDENWCHSDCGKFRGSVRFVTLAAHELGHFIGMQHTDDKTNLMYPVVRQENSLPNVEIHLDELRALTR